MIRPTAGILLPLVLTFAACESSEVRDTGNDAPAPSEFAAIVQRVTVPPELAAGEAAYNANCSVCHGNRGLGTEQGPPLIHIVYEPSHHSDVAFVFAVERGVNAHHWNFGDMPPLPGVEREALQQIIGYVRFLQRQVGIR